MYKQPQPNTLARILGSVLGILLFIGLVVIGFVFFSYLLIIGGVIGLTLWLIAYLRAWRLKRKMPHPSAPPSQQGRTIDHDDQTS